MNVLNVHDDHRTGSKSIISSTLDFTDCFSPTGDRLGYVVYFILSKLSDVYCETGAVFPNLQGTPYGKASLLPDREQIRSSRYESTRPTSPFSFQAMDLWFYLLEIVVVLFHSTFLPL